MLRDDFLKKARLAHHDKYDYSKVDYKDGRTKVCVVCPEHGEFWQTPYSHVKGHGCPRCSIARRSFNRRGNVSVFISKARDVHHGKYDYSKVDYKDSHTKVCVVCPEHGEFWQTPSNHLNGHGCIECYRKGVFGTLGKFVSRALAVHGKRYDYSRVDYVNCDTKVCVVCPEHGEFWQTPSNHLAGRGCPRCGIVGMSKGSDEFITASRLVHGYRYDYSKVDYVNNKTKVRIVCPEHGEFMQRPNDHLSGYGCPRCGIERMARRMSDDASGFVAKAISVHGDRYGYSKVEYKNRHKKVCVTCGIHGDFWIEPSNHLNGMGCHVCSNEEKSRRMSYNVDEFIRKASVIHHGKYDYSKVDYKNSQTKVCVVCPEHGEFWQKANDHLRGCGCPRCGGMHSIKEDEIVNFLMVNTPYEVVQRCRDAIYPMELDVYVPKKRFAVEYDGLVWHSERFNKGKDHRLRKLTACESNGIVLISVFEDEYKGHEDLVNNVILRMLGVYNAEEIDIGKCLVREMDKRECDLFMECYHIGGRCNGSVRLGCFYDGKVISSMVFSRIKDNVWRLSGCAEDYHYRCDGAYARMFNWFVDGYSPGVVMCSVDRRWICGIYDNLYVRLGFRLVKILPPDYTYYCQGRYGGKRVSKSCFSRKRIANEFGASGLDDIDGTLSGIGAYRVWDNGSCKYIWNGASVSEG